MEFLVFQAVGLAGCRIEIDSDVRVRVEVDHVFPMERRMETEVVLRENKTTYSIALFGGVSHGFAVRSDPNNKKEKFAKEKALSDLVYWFKTHPLDS